MTKRLLCALVLGVFLLPVVSAHSSPDPRTFETRLLADCVDDRGHGISTGYDIHSLDIWEFWDGTQEMIGFRLILNGGGDTTITLTFDQDGDAKEYGWIHSNDAWSGTGFAHAERRDDVDDGDRFALIGLVPYDELGGEDAVLSDFFVQTSQSLTGNDEMPGAGPANPECTPDGQNKTPYERPDYTLGEKDVERAYLGKIPDEQTIGLLADNEYFFDVTMNNKITGLKQRVTLEILESTGDATVQFHQPGGEYAATADLELNSRTNPGSERLIHLAFNAPEGASGSVTIALATQVVLKDGTTQPGGYAVRTIDYRVEDEATPSTEPSTMPTDDGVSTPAPGVAFASVVLLAAALCRRR